MKVPRATGLFPQRPQTQTAKQKPRACVRSIEACGRQVSSRKKACGVFEYLAFCRWQAWAGRSHQRSGSVWELRERKQAGALARCGPGEARAVFI